MNRSPIERLHPRANARMGEFAGWVLPIDYGSPIREVLAVRNRAGIFDVSHMARLELSGPDALALAQELLTNDASRLVDLAGQYTLMCNPNGGLMDDLIIYWPAAERLLLVVNAANLDKDLRPRDPPLTPPC